ncbi:EF-hand domain-containing protein [Nonomuraea sp. B12E4]|uniref:EF-hand domain-containing protein n=1 Tax=Nonomuraea sp. B12E4 TaxID=3153564 RepID=UPI00325F3285
MSMDATSRLTRLRARFALLDANGDGQLHAGDFDLLADRVLNAVEADGDSAKAHALREGCRLYWQGLAECIDHDGDSVVTFEEYAAAIPDAFHFDRYGLPYARALAAVCDTDDDGQVEQADFIACMMAIGFAPPQVSRLFSKLAGDSGQVSTGDWAAAIRDFYISSSAVIPGQLLAP